MALPSSGRILDQVRERGESISLTVLLSNLFDAAERVGILDNELD